MKKGPIVLSLYCSMKQYFFPYLLCVSLLFVISSDTFAADANKAYVGTDFMRVAKQEGKKLPTSFDTAITQFTDEKEQIDVHLIGAIHVGDKEYYTELNALFRQYDAVLYELVAEENVKPLAGKNESQSVLSSFQAGMGNALTLDFQLAHIDYQAKNMIHADLSPAEFARRVSDRGDLTQMLYRAMILGIKKSGEESQKEEFKMQGRLLGAFFSSNPSLSLKRVLAEESINQLEDSTWLIGGDGSAIITDRNAAALNVLRREIKNGKKKIAIFYGAAHLPEFAQSLEKDFHLKLKETQWIIAWDLTQDRSARK